MIERGATPGFRAGYIAIVGRPNVGKSTLMNRLIKQKISIVSRKAQTTRYHLSGILTTASAQFVFVDTPGFQTAYRNALNRAMNRSVVNVLASVDAVLFVVEASGFFAADRALLTLLPARVPVIVVLNKTDRLADRARLLPLIGRIRGAGDFAEFVPISAERREGLDDLITTVAQYLPEAPQIFDANEITDRSERFLAAEFLREQAFRRMGDELPYGMAVEIEKFEQSGSLRRIHAAFIVDKGNHKAMLIGENGSRLKRIGSDARRELEALFGGKVFVELWVKVKSGWADDERAIKSLGYA